MEFLPYPHLIPTLFNGCGFGPPLPFTATSTWTWIDHPVSGLLRLTIFALFRLGFPSAPGLQSLTSPASATRRTVLQKVRGSSYKDVPQLVNIWFQVLFHSPPGVLFTFPSQYYALSVTKEYLALEGGPSDFPQGFSCPAVLWILPLPIAFMYEALTLSGRASQPVPLTNQLTYAVRNPSMHARWFRLFRFRSPLLPESMFLSFPPAT